MTVAFEIRRPWPTRRGWPGGGRYWPTLVTIWHVDPETDGSDDSCGWFKRARHGDKAVLAAIERDFAFDWDREYTGWFDVTGWPRMSAPGIVMSMFRSAARAHFGTYDKATPFLRAHLLEILEFAENSSDSMHSYLFSVYGWPPRPREERIAQAASIIYGCVLRWSQPWYRHARWHVRHWSIQVHPAQTFKRWAFSRCAGCARRFAWGYSPVTNSWSGDGPRWFRGERGVYHSHCMPHNASGRREPEAVSADAPENARDVPPKGG